MGETPGRRAGVSDRASLTPRLGSERSSRLDWLAAAAGRAVSLILSLIHVRVPASITVYYRAQTRVYGPSWLVLDRHPTS
jgi:hypothetical protein